MGLVDLLIMAARRFGLAIYLGPARVRSGFWVDLRDHVDWANSHRGGIDDGIRHGQFPPRVERWADK